MLHILSVNWFRLGLGGGGLQIRNLKHKKSYSKLIPIQIGGQLKFDQPPNFVRLPSQTAVAYTPTKCTLVLGPAV